MASTSPRSLSPPAAWAYLLTQPVRGMAECVCSEWMEAGAHLLHDVVGERVQRVVGDLHAGVRVDHGATLVLVRTPDPGQKESVNVFLDLVGRAGVSIAVCSEPGFSERVRGMPIVEVVTKRFNDLDNSTGA